MVTLRERYDPVRLMWRRALLFALFCIVLSATWGVWNIYRKNVEAYRLKVEAQSQLADLEDRQAKLETDYSKLKTGRGMEEAFRDQYAVGKNGEGLIVIVEPDKPQPVVPTPTAWQRFKSLFPIW